MILVNEKQNIAYVRLERPDVRNAFNPELIKELTAIFKTLGGKNNLRAIVLSGEGKVFCAGADLGWMKSMVAFSYPENFADSQKLFEMFEAIKDCEVPVICVVHGAAFGGAIGLMAASDYVIAEEKTNLCFSEVKIGLVPAVISAFILQKAPASAVSHLMMSGKLFAPKEVLGSLVHEIVTEADLQKATEAAVKLFAEAGPVAVRETKKLIKKVQNSNWQVAKEETCKVISERRSSLEGQEGLKSFFEKREPSWIIDEKI